MKKAIAFFLFLCLLATSFGCTSSAKTYAAAQALMDGGEYVAAEAAFKQLGSYKDSPAKAKECLYLSALELMTAEKYPAARSTFLSLGDYKDAPSMAMECLYLYGVQLMTEGAYTEAAAIFEELGPYKDSTVQKAECDNALKYRQAVSLLSAGRTEAGLEDLYAAITLLRELGDYRDSPILLKESCYLAAQRIASADNITVSDCMTAAGLYAESGDFNSDAPDKVHSLNRQALWMYVCQNGTEDTDSDGNACIKLILREGNSSGDSNLETKECLFIIAYDDQTIVLCRELTYASGGVTYTESLCLRFTVSAPCKTTVLASSYTDLGIYSAYILERYLGEAVTESLKTKSDILQTGYVQQARLVSGKNTQTYDYSEQVLIEKILNSVPEFYADFNIEFSRLPFSLSMSAMGFGITDADPVSLDPSSPSQASGTSSVIESDLYVPSENESFKSEQPTIVICPSGATVHKGPSNTYDIVGSVPFGETLQVSALSRDWLYVRYNKREYGWVDMTQLFGSWMFETGINPALIGIAPPKKYVSEPTIISTTDKSNARSGPDTKANQVGSYIAGTQGVLLGTTDMWNFMNFDGEYGWVHKNNFKKNIH